MPSSETAPARSLKKAARASERGGKNHLVSRWFESDAATVKPAKVWRGWPYPLGATWTGNGVNFSLFSENATAVELCLFAALGQPEVARIPLTERRDHVWHAFLPEMRPGQLYGFRVHGPYEPA